MASLLLEELKSLYWELEGHGEDLESGTLQLVSERLGIPVGDVEKGWELIVDSQSGAVDEYHTVFVKEAEWVSGQPCLDFRSNTQYLPRGVWVIGFLGEGKGIFNMPYLSEEQTRSALTVLESVLRRAGDENFAADARRILAEGAIVLDFSESRI